MIKSIFIMSKAGEVMIEKHYRGSTTRSMCDFFWDEVDKYDHEDSVPPIIPYRSFFIMNVFRGGLYLLASVEQEVQPLLVIEFLHRALDIFEEYFGAVNEVVIKENFSLVYQLLEEMVDNGYPMTTEPNALKAMITPPSVMGRMVQAATGKSNVSDVLPDGTISSMPWRKAGVKYTNNEIYLDVVEEVDAIVAANGQVVSSEVSGSIQAVSRLSGVPDMLLSFQDPSLIDDCSFHPCVRYSRFERDRVVSFVPPDGAFELMRYRVQTRDVVIPPIYCTPTISFEDEYNTKQGHIHINVGSRPNSSLVLPSKKSSLLVEEVAVVIRFPKAVRTANLKASVGTVLFDESTKLATWSIGKLLKDKMPQLTGTLLLQGPKPEEAPPIELRWKAAQTSVSGLAVSTLQLANEKYRPYKGVRKMVKSGNFQVRSG